MFPLLADVYYPLVEQNAYGGVKKQWVLDRTIAAMFNPAGRKFTQDIQVNNAKLDMENAIIGRTRNDLTQSQSETLFSLTNIIITNVRDSSGNIIYNESSGTRVGKATIFEVSTFNPIVGAFGSVEYYKIILKRSENQAGDL
jgi:hypothetical protein